MKPAVFAPDAQPAFFADLVNAPCEVGAEGGAHPTAIGGVHALPYLR